MKKVYFVATTALTLVFSACSDSQFDGYTRAENGLHYKFFNHDEAAEKVQEGDGMVISYLITNQKNDSVIIDSKNTSSDGSGYVRFGMSKSSFVGSFEDGMMMMAKGDSAAFIVSADSFFLKTNRQNELPPGFAPGQYLRGIFKIKDVVRKKELEENQKKQQAEQEVMMKEAEAKEKPALEKYLADNKITTKPTASGLIYIETKKGSGASPKETDVIKMHYTGTLLDGTVFDSSIGKEPIEYPLNQMIQGWIEGVQLMKKGGKAKLIVPSALGYGPRGGGPIPPFSPLVFEVELLDFKAGEPQSQPGMEPAH